MKEILTLNQAKSIEFGFKNVQCAAIFTIIADLIEKNKDGIELKEIADQLPLLNLKTETIRGYIVDLEKKNVIVRQKNTGKKHIINLTELGKKYFEVKEKNPDNDILSILDNFIGEINKKFFLLSEVGKHNPVEYNEAMIDLIDSMINNGIYDFYFSKVRVLHYTKELQCRLKNVEIDHDLIDLKSQFIDFTKEPNVLKGMIYCNIDSPRWDQNHFNHLMDLISIFYREKYLNREISWAFKSNSCQKSQL